MQERNIDLPQGLPLSFVEPVVVVGGGLVDKALLRRLADGGAHVIAADGGAEACADAGLLPEAIIGDMDSLAHWQDWGQRTRVVRIEEQETTDFEKCLYATRAPVTIVLGVTGKRLDHTLAALNAVARYGGDRAILLVDVADVALGLKGPFAFEVAAGARVSLHPLTAVRFARSEGLLYPLNGLTLAPGARTGTSNAAVSGPFAITPEAGSDGVYLLLLDKTYLDTLATALLA